MKEYRIAKALERKGFEIQDIHHVIRMNQHRKAEIDIVARRGPHKYAIESKAGHQILTARTVEHHVRRARKIGATPVFAVGPNVTFTGPAWQLIRKYRVRVWRA